MSSRINVDLDELGLSGKTASDLAVVIFDYATNYDTYSLDPDVTPTPTEPGASPTPTVPVVTPTPTDPTATPTPTVPVVTPTPADPTVTPTTSVPVATPTPTNPTQAPTKTPTHSPDPDPTSNPPQPTVTPTTTATPTPEVPPLIDSVKVTPSSKTLYVGKTSKITVNLPSALTYKDVTSISYSSNNNSIAVVSTTGTITAKKTGSAAITTKVTINGSSKNFTTKVTVKNPYISLGKKPTTVYAGNSYDFSAKAYGISDKITYSVSDTTLAAINKETGKLTAIKAGSVYVTAKAGSITKKIKLTIKKPYISFTRKQAAVKVLKSFDFNAKAYGVTGKITYSVSDTKLASITKKTGVLTAKKAGTVYVTAKVGNVSSKYKVVIER